MVMPQGDDAASLSIAFGRGLAGIVTITLNHTAHYFKLLFLKWLLAKH